MNIKRVLVLNLMRMKVYVLEEKMFKLVLGSILR